MYRKTDVLMHSVRYFWNINDDLFLVPSFLEELLCFICVIIIKCFVIIKTYLFQKTVIFDKRMTQSIHLAQNYLIIFISVTFFFLEIRNRQFMEKCCFLYLKMLAQ